MSVILGVPISIFVFKWTTRFFNRFKSMNYSTNTPTKCDDIRTSQHEECLQNFEVLSLALKELFTHKEHYYLKYSVYK